MVARSHKRHLADGHRQALATHLGINGGIQHGVRHIDIPHGYRLADNGPEATGCHHPDALAGFTVKLSALAHRRPAFSQQANTLATELLGIDLMQNHIRSGEAASPFATVAPRLANRPDQARLYRRGFAVNIITVKT